MKWVDTPSPFVRNSCANINKFLHYNMINSELETFIFMENINIAPGSLLKSVLVRSWVGMLVRS